MPIHLNPTIQPPLSRRGTGPGLVLLVHGASPQSSNWEKTLDPPPVQKWAEEGFAVVELRQVTIEDAEEDGFTAVESALQQAVSNLMDCKNCEINGKEGEGVGFISYVDTIPPRVLEHLHSRPYIKAIVSHSGTTSIPSPSDSSHSIPHLLHIPGSGPESLPASDTGNIKKYTYPSAAPNSSHWILPAAEEYDSASANIAHTRSLEFLKPVLGGPHFDIEAVWEEHTKFEFVERDVAATMATMVAQPYVNHIPTMTGGVGKDRLTAFYTHHFIHSNPPDTRLRLLSRSISINRIIDEFLLELTHTSTVDWLLPSLPPTNRPLSIPMTSIVTLRGDKLCHEHISWDQGTVLMQLGLMPQWLKFPYEIDTGGVGGTRKAREGERFEVRTPCVGMEGSRKAVDEMEGESNVLIKKGREEGYWREVEDI